MNHLISLISGIIFGLGLAISGMINPLKVLAFLDITGNWDASLLFVLGGAVTVTFIGYRIVFRRSSPFFESKFRLPEQHSPDRKLVLGAALFGIGWGLVGYCPGPALASLALPNNEVLWFVVAMLAGAWLANFINQHI